MTRPIAVLRPEPGNAATLARLADAGLDGFALPLFAVRSVPWVAPLTDEFDAILFTSANAPRYGGDQLATLSSLPAVVVGSATAAAARQAGFNVVITGNRDMAAAIGEAQAAGFSRLLHLRGHDVTDFTDRAVRCAVTVYASEALPVSADQARRLDGSVALLHSPRAARRLGEIIGGLPRHRLRLAVLSPAVGEAAGPGWDAVAVAAQPNDAALIAAAASLAD